MAYVKLPTPERYFVCISADNSNILILKRSIDRPGDTSIYTGFEFFSSNFLIVIVLAEPQAVNTGKRGKPLGQNVYGTGRITGWKRSRD
jgi:hypothetical protein